MDLKDITKAVEKIDKDDVEKVVDTVKEGAKKMGIEDLDDVKEKLSEVTDKIKK